MVKRLCRGLALLTLILAGYAFLVTMNSFGAGSTNEALQSGFYALWCLLLQSTLRKAGEEDVTENND